MFRFTIRDVLWLTVVAGFAICWWLERTRHIDMAERRAAMQSHAVELKTALAAARSNDQARRMMVSFSSNALQPATKLGIRYRRVSAGEQPVDWELADKPLPR